MRMRTILVIALVATLLLVSPLTGGRAHAANEPICFPEVPAISACIDSQFAPFWRANGGLAVFGYPISAAQAEVNAETGKSYLTQYFERQRFEYHPEHAAPYNVQLGRVGDAYLGHTGRDWHQMAGADPQAHHYMPETGHAIAPEFYDYYRGIGVDLGDPGLSERESLALFGYPITEAFAEDVAGQSLLVQYFERARLEYHPNNLAAYRVQQGLLSSDLHAEDAAHHDHHTAPGPTDDHHDSQDPGDDHHDSRSPGSDHSDDPMDHR